MQVDSIVGDFRTALPGGEFDGLLAANSLHFVTDPGPSSRRAAVRPDGRVVSSLTRIAATVGAAPLLVAAAGDRRRRRPEAAARPGGSRVGSSGDLRCGRGPGRAGTLRLTATTERSRPGAATERAGTVQAARDRRTEVAREPCDRRPIAPRGGPEPGARDERTPGPRTAGGTDPFVRWTSGAFGPARNAPTPETRGRPICRGYRPGEVETAVAGAGRRRTSSLPMGRVAGPPAPSLHDRPAAAEHHGSRISATPGGRPSRT
jgi:hypothetical protein